MTNIAVVIGVTCPAITACAKAPRFVQGGGQWADNFTDSGPNLESVGTRRFPEGTRRDGI
jgi:hypothetical protein